MLEILDCYPRTSKYPKVFRANSIEDMQSHRAEESTSLKRGSILFTSFGDQPNVVSTPPGTSIIYLPEVQHHSALDPQEDIKKLFGLTRHDNLGMRLTDKTGSIATWYHNRSFLHFPYTASFNDDNIFNKDSWKAWRDIPWSRGVIILAQYSLPIIISISKLLEEPQISDHYWLVDILDLGSNPWR